MIYALLVVAGVAVGALGMGGIRAAAGGDHKTVEAAADLAGEVGDSNATVAAEVGDGNAKVAEEAGDAANAVQLAELEVSKVLAAAPASTQVCKGAVEPGATDRVVALCAYLGCMAHVEGSETSAGLGCLTRGQTLDELLDGYDGASP